MWSTTVKIVGADLNSQTSQSGFNYEGRGKGKLSFVPSWVRAFVKIVMLLVFVTRPGLAWPRSNVVSMY